MREVGIGTTTPTEKLEVNGAIKANDLKLPMTNWADFVFEPGYKLKPLTEVESYVTKEKHLPGVPSEDEIKKTGVSVAKIQMLHMQKIEELTLYAIAQAKKTEALTQNINAMTKKSTDLEKQIKELQSEKAILIKRLDDLERMITQHNGDAASWK